MRKTYQNVETLKIVRLEEGASKLLGKKWKCITPDTKKKGAFAVKDKEPIPPAITEVKEELPTEEVEAIQEDIEVKSTELTVGKAIAYIKEHDLKGEELKAFVSGDERSAMKKYKS